MNHNPSQVIAKIVAAAVPTINSGFYFKTQIWQNSKVVKRLSVNRLPVKLPITGFNFQLPIYRHFSSRNAIFGFSFVSHTHAGQQRPV